MDKGTKQWLQALSYPLWPVALITLVAVEDKDKTLQYHAAQGLTFSLLAMLVWWILDWFLVWWIFGSIVGLLGLALFVLSIYYAVRAYKGEIFKVPIAYDVMQKFKK